MNNKSFQKLQQLWYNKIKRKGFVDIEDDQGRLKHWSGVGDINLEEKAVRPESQAEYYRLASQFVYDKEFPTAMHKSVWKLHSEGKPEREIAKILRLSHGSVHHMVITMKRGFFK